MAGFVLKIDFKLILEILIFLTFKTILKFSSLRWGLKNKSCRQLGK
jgi:hypothetical protein